MVITLKKIVNRDEVFFKSDELLDLWQLVNVSLDSESRIEFLQSDAVRGLGLIPKSAVIDGLLLNLGNRSKEKLNQQGFLGIPRKVLWLVERRLFTEDVDTDWRNSIGTEISHYSPRFEELLFEWEQFYGKFPYEQCHNFLHQMETRIICTRYRKSRVIELLPKHKSLVDLLEVLTNGVLEARVDLNSMVNSAQRKFTQLDWMFKHELPQTARDCLQRNSKPLFEKLEPSDFYNCRTCGVQVEHPKHQCRMHWE